MTEDQIISICDAHGIPLPPECIEQVIEIIRLTGATQAADAARYNFLRNDENWPQNDRYWEALSAGGEKLDKVIDDGIKSRAEDEEADDF